MKSSFPASAIMDLVNMYVHAGECVCVCVHLCVYVHLYNRDLKQ